MTSYKLILSFCFRGAYVYFNNVGDAIKSMKMLDGQVLDGFKIKLDYMKSNCETWSTTSLSVRNLPADFSESTLTEWFPTAITTSLVEEDR